MAPPTVRFQPGRYLAAFLVIVAALYGLVFFTGDGSPTPKLGIDLQGGTRVTLTARTETGAAPTPDQLNLARTIIEQRVNGLGVSGAEVVQDGSNLVITVPGQEGDQARSLGQTARLYFRPVLGGPIPAGPQPGQPGQPAQPGAPPGQGTAEQGGASGAGTPGQTPGGQSAPIAAPNQPAPNQPAPPPTPPPGGGDTSQDPRQAQAIAEAKATRQSEDPAVQEQAALALNCAVEDPLRGYDDPTKPLIACNREGTEKYLLGPSILSGTDVASATPNPNPQGVGWVINLAFKGGQPATTWADYTSANVNNSNAVVLDTQVVSALRIQQPLLDGNAMISGQFNQGSATDFANVLRYGSLPLSFDTSEAQTVSATLGLASLQAGLIAGVVGLALVFIYSLFYYRALGVLTILSLILSGAVVYAVLVLLGRTIGFTLDLAGVAGFIVAIGITADSFVIFFERIKDEVRDGRSFRSAVPRGWTRARRTILSGDAVSFLAAVVLYVLAVGQVKGFAFTLGMSTVLDLIVVFLVTHPLLALASNSKLFASPAWSGLGQVVHNAPRAGAAGPRPGGRGNTRGGARDGAREGARSGARNGSGASRTRAGRGGDR
ncbi:preprotein translocase subunit SecD [Actinomycetospora succinea]|uniref:Protein translocase subunit SecD n=1 Tax=Actinomycetospora succinea TaxID=663603 RepID=A0A4R6UNX6_9PSEU|nr:protein translocase subunit SecD [Actinomycetospora succinea]TDQ47329.1 preprotein translocase subunit SecD [Actinomycetospora succinea]